MTKLEQQSSLLWKKSSVSGVSSCVEVAKAQEMMLVRDSKNPGGSVLAFSTAEWRAVMIDVRTGQYPI
jgi:hypothetical protein